MSDPIEEIKASFFIECEELLESLFDALQRMADEGADDDTINVAFRAVHSIKGGAGAFSLTELVAFAHEFETVMDRLRAHDLTFDGDLGDLFLRAGDVLHDLVRTAREGNEADLALVAPLLEALAAHSGNDTSDEAEEEEPIDFAPATIDLGDLEPGGEDAPALDFDDLPPLPDLDDEPEPTEAQKPEVVALAIDAPAVRIVRFRPTPELYESGNEPLYLLRALEDLAPCSAGLSKIDFNAPLGAGLEWRIEIATDDEAAITANFEFVEGLCELTVSPPGPDADPPDPDPSDDAEDSEPSNDASLGGRGPDGPNASMQDFGGDVGLERSPDDNEPATSAEDPLTSDTLDEDVDGATPDKDTPSAAPGGEAPPEDDTGDPGADASGDAPADPPPAAPQPSKTPVKANQPKRAAAAVSPTVRVDLERIDRLVNLVGELVINQSMLSQSVSDTALAKNTTVNQGLEELLQLTRDIQESVMMIRAQPVKSLFQRLGRIVREASAAVDKKVRLVTEGEATEVDKTVIERLADPLTHMIRNAVDHGLEGAADRSAAGKPEEGVVRLTAAHKSGRVAIEISDDGRGINREKVFAKAVERDLVDPDAQLTDTEIDQLLFLPGFSTADKVSNLSGRGVGMDVVKNAISALGGNVTIASRPGRGTTFSISLPLTLAVLDGMIVSVANETLVVPLTAVSETLTLSDDDVRPLTPSTNVVKVRDAFVPLLDLGYELGYRAPPDSFERTVALLIRQEDGRRAALLVDRIEDQRQVVIKGLEESYGHIAGIAAATILGDGQIALILDPDDLVTNATGLSSSGAFRKAG